LIDRIFSEARAYLPKNASNPPVQGRTGGVRQAISQPSVPVGASDLGQQPLFEGSASPESPDFNPEAPLTVGTAQYSPYEQAPSSSSETIAGDRIELGLPDGKLSLPETLANLDAALTVLWARRQLVAAIDAADGRPTPAPPKDFTRPSTRR